MWKDKINVNEINIVKSEKNISELIQYLVLEIEMNETKVHNGIKKSMTKINMN